jgi:dihydropteroate synthase
VTPIEQRFRRPSVMGVVNVTPDSFSDGGVNRRAEDAVAFARQMLDDGAAIVDVGGESTRPGSQGVALEEELRRVVPVLEALAGAPLSIDTSKAEVARRALALGAELVNDVTALRGDPELAGAVAEANAYVCLMHMRGEPRTMQQDPRYDDVASEVAAFLEERLRFAVEAGIPEEHICLDPGIGFGKTVEQNFELVRRLDVLLALGRPVVIGFSRKSSLGRLLGNPAATTGSAAASLGAAVAAYERGASILRVHDVRETVEALTVAHASRSWGAAGNGGAAGGAQDSTTSTDKRRRRRILPPAASGVRRGRLRRPGADAGQGREGSDSVIVELHALEVFGRHGLLDEERRDGQTFLFDVTLEVAEPTADDVEKAVDYRDVADRVKQVSDGTRFDLLETLAAAVADALAESFPVAHVRVRVRKPRPVGVPMEWSAATAER